jgi:intracellular sulfur oxidation DsrE/DsrF family protein
MQRILLATTLLVLAATSNSAEPPTAGPVVKTFGPVFAPPENAYNLAPDVHYKVSMDVSRTGDFPEDRNRSIESAARFLNMHARNGIPPENLEFALIVHGPATKDLLTDAAYQARYEEANPNTAMLRELEQAGVKIYLCSQSAAYKNFTWNEFNPAVTIAVSAMTAHVRLQQEGYTLIPF